MTHEEAIKIVKEFINGTCLHLVDQEALETLIPELAESEDERIRKSLIEVFKKKLEKGFEWTEYSIPNRSVLGWLEKQKELPFVKDVILGHPGIYFYDGERMHFQGNPAMEENPYDFAMSQQEPHYTKRNALFDKCVENCDPEIMKRVSDEVDEKLKEQKPAACIDFDNEFENQISHLLASVLNGEYEYNEGFVKYAAQSLLGHAKKEQIPYIDFVIKPHKGDDNNPYDMGVSEALEYVINRGFDIRFNDGEVFIDERHMTQTIGNILRWADEHPNEQKPAEWNEEDRHAIENCEYAIKETFKDEQNPHRIGTLDWLKSLRPKKNISYGELPLVPIDYMEGLDTDFEKQVGAVIASAMNREHQFTSKYIKWTAQQLMECAKDKQNSDKEWNEDDKTRLKVITEELGRFIMFSKYGTPLSVDDVDWLKNLPERFSLRPKQEWSGDDNVLLNNIISVIQNKKYINDNDGRKAYVDFLKSLPERFVLQPRQEWSEEAR